MASIRAFSNEQKLLLAVTLCAEGNFNDLQRLQAQEPNVLTTELTLRVLLTALPEGADPSSYVPLLRSLLSEQRDEDQTRENLDARIDTHSIDELSPTETREKVRQLRLYHIKPIDSDANGDLLARFLVQRSHQIDSETGNLLLVLQLVEPFVDQSENLRQWVISRLLPLLRVDYEYYPQQATGLSLKDFETLHPRAAIELLMRHAEGKENNVNVGRDLRQMVGPWMYGESRSKRRKLDTGERRSSIADRGEPGWQIVNEWLLEREFDLASQAFVNWSGPQDVDLGGYQSEDYTTNTNDAKNLTSRYVQTMMAAVYAQRFDSGDVLSRVRAVHSRITELMNFPNIPEFSAGKPPDLSQYDDQITDTTAASVMLGNLLQSTNPLTLPTVGSHQLLTALVYSASLLRGLGHAATIKELLELCLFSNETTQKQELRKILQLLTKPSVGLEWGTVYEQLNWLRTWGNESLAQSKSHNKRALFWRVDQAYLDTEFLTTLISVGGWWLITFFWQAMLIRAEYQFAVQTYLEHSSKTALSISDCEPIVESSIYTAYDNASNGNRNRGGVKRASDILKAFKPYFQQSDSFRRIEPLLTATHSISFYHLALEHGVPFQPVNIRVLKDPLSLIDKILDQNHNAYTKLDDLLGIGRNLVAAGLADPSRSGSRSMSISSIDFSSPIEDQQSEPQDPTHRITFLSIQSALTNNDFDTAYSYILTRLSPSPTSTPSSTDDISWRAAYLAGRYRPPAPPHPPPLHIQISALAKRMELLSLALTLAPTPEPLPEILGTWRRCEEELGSLQSAEAEAESAWEEKGAMTSFSGIPGEWDKEEREIAGEERRMKERRIKGKTRWEEAPVGLFEVARAGARAFGRATDKVNATHAASPATAQKESGSPLGAALSGATSPGLGEEGQRVRKRDMVSGLVTGGLVKGVGWVLGAQPVAKGEDSGPD
ncbi:MAG: hypothetical protein Q9227_003783 [Pyrenula ochraceoflavens]